MLTQLLFVAMVAMVHAQTLWTCPDRCDCSTVGEVKCVSTDIPHNLPTDTATFEIEQCATPIDDLKKAVSNHLLRLPNLKNLAIKSCGIQMVEDYTFLNFKNLLSLDLSENNIQEIGASSFLGLFGLENLVLNNNKIAKIALGALNTLVSLKTLDLQNNDISEIALGMFSSLINLEELNLSNNLMDKVPSNSFLGLNSLTVLHIGQNPVALIEDEAFNNLPQLTELSLSTSDLLAIPSGTFTKSPLLNFLELHSNGSKLSENFFGNLGLTNLQTIFLGGKNTIPPKAFTGLASLNVLSISGNYLEATLEEVFEGVEGLQTLFMDDMGLTTIDKLLKNTGNLLMLSLMNNKLTNVSGTDFNHLLQLTTLILEENRISDIEQALAGLPTSVVSLSLGSNAIQTIPESVRSFLATADIDFANNPLHCNCELKWLRKDYPESRFPLLECHTPTKVKFYGLQVDDFNCTAPSLVRETFLSFAGDSLVLNCSATSDPSPKITWTATDKGRVVQVEEPDEDRTVFFNSNVLRLTSKDFPEEYVCKAQNVYGEVEISFGASGKKNTS